MQAGSKGSELRARGASCWLSKAPGRSQRPRDTQRTRGAREQAGDFLRLQGSRDAEGARGVSWEQGE